jgi:hypothetical protein
MTSGWGVKAKFWLRHDRDAFVDFRVSIDTGDVYVGDVRCVVKILCSKLGFLAEMDGEAQHAIVKARKLNQYSMILFSL